MSTRSDEVTRLLRDWSAGNAEALNQLAPLVYEELHRVAGKAGPRRVKWGGRWSFRRHRPAPGPAGRWKRSRRNPPSLLPWTGTTRRPRGRSMPSSPCVCDRALSLDDVVACAPDRSESLLALDDAMNELAVAAPDKCRMIEMHFFGGMTQEEIATVLSVHVNTVARHLRVAEAWLQSRMTG